MDLDVEKAEAGLEASLPRNRSRENANREEAAWKESVQRQTERRRNRNRWGWIRYHGDLHRLHTKSANEHAEKRARLLQEAGWPPDDGPPEAA